MRIVQSAFALALALLVTAPVGGGLSAQTSPAAAFFNDGVLHDVRLFINSRDLVQLRERYREAFNVPADFIWGTTRVRNVRVHVRGAGSRTPIKPGLDVSFDHYTAGQQFLGLTNLVLDNLWQDPSLFREHLAMAVFRRLGQAAPRESFARVFINNEYHGVYGLVEAIDPQFAAAATGNVDGRLFEYRYVMPFFGQYLGEDVGAYKPLFALRSDTTDTDAMLYGPIRDFFRDANVLDDPAWRERVDALMDLPQLVAHTAIQGCLADIDGFMGYAGLNNFYLYRPAGSTRHRLFPWDVDFAFNATDLSIFRRGDEPVPLFERALGEPDLHAHFLDTAGQCADRLDEDGWLASEVERLVGLVGSAIIAHPKIRTFAAERPRLLRAEVTAERARVNAPVVTPAR
jgi:spore coat protein CotH